MRHLSIGAAIAFATLSATLREVATQNTLAMGVEPQREDRRERRKIARAIAKSNAKLRKGAR